MRVLTWHVHGGYLFYLAHGPYELVVPVKPGRPPRYVGLPAGGYPWPASLREVPADEVCRLRLDCVLFQCAENYAHDQYEILTAPQRLLPRIFLEHDPPRASPTDTRHPVDDSDVLLVHVTPFNQLMWDAGRTPTTVIEHGVSVPDGVRATGELPRGLAIVNELRRRGRRLGLDVFLGMRREVPLDLVGMDSAGVGGLGEIPHDRLPAFAARYRFLFNPIRYTSLGLAVCEAMMVGLPVLGLATTEMATAVESGVSGFVDTRQEVLAERARELVRNPREARRLGQGARRAACERFWLERFVADWSAAFELVAGARAGRGLLGAGA